MAISDKLQELIDIKQDIKEAIENKDVDLTGVDFGGYAGKIDEIQTGGGGTQLYKHMIDMTFINADYEELSVSIILTNNSNTEITQLSQLRNYNLNAIPIFVRIINESSIEKELFASFIAGTGSTINFIGIGFENGGNNLSLIDEISLIIADLNDLTDTVTAL